MLVVDSPEAALDLLSAVREQIGEGVSAFELIHGEGLEFLHEKMPQVRQPFAERPRWSVLIEVRLAKGLNPEDALMSLFEEAVSRGLVLDGVIAQSEADTFSVVHDLLLQAGLMQ